MKCPECSKELVLKNRCVCGWQNTSQSQKVDSNYGICSWTHRNGARCTQIDSLCPGIGEPKETRSGEGSRSKWYCGWHYECLTRHLDETIGSEDQIRFEERDVAYDEMASKRMPKFVTWDPDDMAQIKGLIFLGEGSTSWNHAPEVMKEAVRFIQRTGWKENT